jgi:hypothetical protein
MSFDDFYLILQGLNLKTNKNIFFRNWALFTTQK